MAKRKSSIILSEFIPEGERTEGGPVTRVRTFRADVHYKLKLVAVKWGNENGKPLDVVPGVFDSNGLRSEFKAHLREHGVYFTTDEYTHLAEYLRGAADALEMVD